MESHISLVKCRRKLMFVMKFLKILTQLHVWKIFWFACNHKNLFLAPCPLSSPRTVHIVEIGDLERGLESTKFCILVPAASLWHLIIVPTFRNAHWSRIPIFVHKVFFRHLLEKFLVHKTEMGGLDKKNLIF